MVERHAVNVDVSGSNPDGGAQKNMNKKISSGVVHYIPADVKKIFIASPKVITAWEHITPLARNEWICWITSAKKDETRIIRIQRALSDLAAGKKRPCCWAGCPHRK